MKLATIIDFSMTKNDKHAFIVFAFVALLVGRDFIKKGLTEFYLYKIDKTETTKGVVLKSHMNDFINGMSLQCLYLYHVNNKVFRKYESIAVYDTLTKLKAEDSLQVRYNVNRPWDGTINTDYNLRTVFLMSFVLLVWILCAIVFLIIEVINYFRRKQVKRSLN